MSDRQTTAVQVVHATLSDVALIDATTCANAGAMSVSWWHEAVRLGQAPAPVIRKPRCTRWRLIDVRNFWDAFARSASDDPSWAAVTAQATKASRAAQVKRQADKQRTEGVES